MLLLECLFYLCTHELYDPGKEYKKYFSGFALGSLYSPGKKRFEKESDHWELKIGGDLIYKAKIYDKKLYSDDDWQQFMSRELPEIRKKCYEKQFNKVDFSKPFVVMQGMLYDDYEIWNRNPEVEEGLSVFTKKRPGAARLYAFTEHNRIVLQYEDGREKYLIYPNERDTKDLGSKSVVLDLDDYPSWKKDKSM